MTRFTCSSANPFLSGSPRPVAATAILISLLIEMAPSWARPESGSTVGELVKLPIEQLLNLEVEGASKFPQKVTEAPASVTVVTAAEIRDFGHRTLADVLRSIKGLHVSHDRNYSYLGVRGFSRPADYNTRVLLLVDGHRFNDNVYDQASIGSEFPIDIDLIDRVEFVPGPGSSLYGSNAFFGVVNVITRRGDDFGGLQASASAGSHRGRSGRLTWGGRLGEEAELLLSVSGHRSRGADHYYPEFVPLGVADGMARGLDFDRDRQIFAKLSLGGWSFSAIHGERRKGIPTAPYETVAGMAGTQTDDQSTFLDMDYQAAPGSATQFSARLFYGRYKFRGDYLYDYPPLTLNRDRADGQWWGGEARWLYTGFSGHKLAFGAEYQRDQRMDQINYDESPHFSYLEDRRRGNRFGLYLQDDLDLKNDWRLNAGLRYDHASNQGGIFNPRLALIRSLLERTYLKLIYGSAYRAPNAYESYYAVPGAGGQKSSPGLKPERIRSMELAVEHYFRDDFRLTGSLFRNRIRDLISASVDPADGLLMFSNLSQASAGGMTLEVERAWAGNRRLRASYTWQSARDETGARLTNSPRHLAKLNWSAPIIGDWLRGGAELQYTGARRTLSGGDAGGYWLGNLNLIAPRLARDLELSVGIYNLFNRKFADPGGPEHVQDAIVQDGRTARVKLSYRF